MGLRAASYLGFALSLAYLAAGRLATMSGARAGAVTGAGTWRKFPLYLVFFVFCTMVLRRRGAVLDVACLRPLVTVAGRGFTLVAVKPVCGRSVTDSDSICELGLRLALSVLVIWDLVTWRLSPRFCFRAGAGAIAIMGAVVTLRLSVLGRVLVRELVANCRSGTGFVAGLGDFLAR